MRAVATVGSGTMEWGLEEEGGSMEVDATPDRDAHSREGKETPWPLLTSYPPISSNSASYWSKLSNSQLARRSRNKAGKGWEMDLEQAD